MTVCKRQITEDELDPATSDQPFVSRLTQEPAFVQCENLSEKIVDLAQQLSTTEVKQGWFHVHG